MTPRQRQVAELVAHGYTDKQISHELGISVRRVQYVIERIAELWHLDPSRSYRTQIAQREAA